MKTLDTPIEGIKIIEPDRFGDNRGWFCETFNSKRYASVGIDAHFVQDNESFSSKGVIRGLHWQSGAHCQAKLVRVISGSVWDVVVDIRKDSATYGKHVAVVLRGTSYALSDDFDFGPNVFKPAPGAQVFIPRGFAHGFIVLEDNTLFSYKCDNLYCKEAERGMLFSDPALGIHWPEIGVPLTLSAKDQVHPLFKNIEPYC